MPTSSDQVRNDFDAIASIAASDSGRRNYDNYLLSLIPNDAKDVLDVGCGFGALSHGAMRPGRYVVGVDLSPGMIARASTRSQFKAINFVCGDFLDFDWKRDSFDCILCAATLHHMSADRVIVRMTEILRPGGRLVLHDLRRDASLTDLLTSFTVAAWDRATTFFSTGRMRESRAVRQAWKQHGESETYLSIVEARSLARNLLPGSEVLFHALWRYTIIWDKPAAA